METAEVPELETLSERLLRAVDYYGLVRAVRAVDRAHVALLVLDATDGLTAEDKHIAERVIEAGRGLLVTANKWDLVGSDERDRLFKELTEQIKPFAQASLLRTSALSGTERKPWKPSSSAARLWRGS